MALLHALHELGYRHLVVCHVNHGLRARAALRDAALVRAAARRLGYACEATRVRTADIARREGKSLEWAGRDLRRAFFAQCSRKYRCRSLFLAHHAGDQVETILFNFLRGTGTAGLGGMHPSSTWNRLEILRPMLGIPREEIIAFVRSRRIPHGEDATNADPVHTRNRLRHAVIPVLSEAIGPSFPESVLRAAEILREEHAWMESLLPPDTERLSCAALRSMPLALQRRIVRRWLGARGLPEAGFHEVRLVLSLLNDGSGPAKVNLPGSRHARRTAGKIFLEAARR